MPWRSPHAARPPAPDRAPLLSSLPNVLPTWPCSLSMLAMISLSACSTANDVFIGGEGSSGDAAYSTGGDSGQPASGSGGTSGSSASDSDGDPNGENDSGDPTSPPTLPPGEPTPEDIIETKGRQVDARCDLQTPLVAKLRTGDASASVSPAQARDAALSGWVSLMGIRIRPWEFFNYYNFDYPNAPTGEVTVTPQLALVTGGDPSQPEFLLQVGVSSKSMTADQRPPLRLTLALDNSNSMAGTAQDLLHAASQAIVANLRAGDTVSLITWNPKNQVLLELHKVTGANDSLVLDKLESYTPGGSAELYNGLVMAYKLADAAYDPNAWNRIVLISDGGASATETDLAIIANHATKTPGVLLTGIGVGNPGTYRSDLLEATARAGFGHSLYIGTPDEADKRLGSQFLRTFGASVRQLEVHLELPPGFEIWRDPETDFLHDYGAEAGVRLGPNASLVLHRHIHSCAALDFTAKLSVHATFIDDASGKPMEVQHTVNLAALLAETPASLHKGAAVAAYAEVLRRWQSYPAGLEEALNTAAARLFTARELLPNDAELDEISEVLAVLQAG